jgi:hypothetical protein
MRMRNRRHVVGAFCAHLASSDNPALPHHSRCTSVMTSRANPFVMTFKAHDRNDRNDGRASR